MCSGSGAKVTKRRGAERACGQTEERGDAVEQRSAPAIGIEDRRPQRRGADSDADVPERRAPGSIARRRSALANRIIAAPFRSRAARITGLRPT